MKKLVSIMALIIFGALQTFSTQSAQADVPPVPENVLAWFSGEGQKIIESLSSPSSDIPPDLDGPRAYPFGSIVGEPVAVTIWSTAFLRATNPTIDMLVPRGDWMAPILCQGKPLGVLVAYRSNAGTMEWMADPNKDASAALLALRPTDIVADDGLNGLFLVRGNTARQYGLSQQGIQPTAGSLKQLQGAILAQEAEFKAANADAGEILTGGGPFAFDQYIQQHPEASLISNAWEAIITVGIVALMVVGFGAGILSRRRNVLSSMYDT